MKKCTSGKQFGIRLTEHRKEAEKTGNRNFTRCTSRSSASEYHKSAITDHVCQNNHATDWEAGEIVKQESDKFKRWIRERIHIGTNSPTITGMREHTSYPLCETNWSPPPTRGEGGPRQSDLACFCIIINTYRSLFKAPGMFGTS